MGKSQPQTSKKLTDKKLLAQMAMHYALHMQPTSSIARFMDPDIANPGSSIKADAIPSADVLHYDWALKEIECARSFNVELPENLHMAVEMLENAVASVTGTQQNVILLLDEFTGVYTCLNDEKNPNAKPRELTQISDSFLKKLLKTDAVIQTHLQIGNKLLGIVAVADKTNGKPLNVQDEITLELMASYLATKVLRYQSLKNSLVLPYKQRMVLEMAGDLISAVDQDDIITHTLERFATRFDFGVVQYVALNPETGLGEVLYEKSESGHVRSFTHAGLEGKRKVVKEFASLISLLSSVARSDSALHLSGRMLGDKSLSAMFSVKNVESALIVPVINITTGQIKGTFNLYRTKPVVITPEIIDIIKDTCILAANALGRCSVLEKAIAMASCDELTGLLNRRGFYERFESEIERARRHPTRVSLALLDVDHFKQFNDEYGHLSGDMVLKTLAELFQKSLRKSDMVCRFGGEEFAILLPDTAMHSAADLIERLRAQVAAATICGINGEQLKVTISAGVTELDLTQVTNKDISMLSKGMISDALAMADEQLYVAKDQGRNQVCMAALDAKY